MENRAMDSERWQNIERLYHAALECEEGQRAAFLTRACGSDEALLQEVESLVFYGSRSERLIEGSALELVAPAIAADEGDEHDPASDECRMIDKKISQYRIVEQLGRGGMGEVYRAYRADGQFQKQVAIKFVRAGQESGSVIGRFKNERQILAGLDHLNIARLLDGGATEEGVPYFVMELVEGQPIDEYCDTHRLRMLARLQIFLQVCSALEYAHQHQVIHRDIKPSNILVTEEGVPKLLDFGIAKILDSGVVAGMDGLTQTMFRVFTPKYASPEQIKAEPITMASDVYSLGVLLYELLTGHPPYRLKTRAPAELEQAICEQDPLQPSVVVTRVEEEILADDSTPAITPEEISRARGSDPKQMHSCLLGDLDAIVMMALRKEPHRRYASVHDFSEDIHKHLEGLPINARPSTIAYRGAKFVRRHRELAVGTLVFLVLLGGLFASDILLHWGWSRAPTRKTLTEKDFVVLADFANSTGDAVFNDTLKTALSVSLRQSPFLNVLPDSQVAKTLQLMTRPPSTKLTLEVTRELCQRAGGNAYIAGSVASLGSEYVLALKAVNCESGDALAQEQVTAASKEKVLDALGKAASKLRVELGESLASIQKHDAPLEQVTTPSLEALQAYTVAMGTWRSQGDMAAVPLFKRAIGLDSNFALAHASLAVMYSNLNEPALSAESAKKAYELRLRVTERERFAIDWKYYESVTEELDQMAEVNEQRKQMYPRDLASYVNLGLVDSLLGRPNQALDNGLMGLQLGSDYSVVYSNLSVNYMSLDRLDEAKAILDQARARQLDDSLLPNYYQLAFLRDDAKEMDRCVSASTGKSGIEDQLLSSQSDTEAFHGRMEKAREYSRRAVASALAAGEKEMAAGWQGNAALREAEFGNAAEAKQQAAAALAVASNRDVQVAAAMAFARAGALTRAQTMAGELRKSYPKGTLLNNYWLPCIRAAMAIRHGDPQLAIGFLQVTAPYELGGMPPSPSGATLYPAYLRGEAYMSMRRWSQAAAEFQKILDHRGLVWNFPLSVLARLQLGRAYARTGDTAGARKEYMDFLSLWRDADPNIPILREAKAEFGRLK
jgi:serine/threonine protein kinase/tetratricopeptide (TPR) repeat protein